MKQIAVIGASSGIGRKVAEDFARMGWRVAVAARREEPLKELAAKYPDNVVYYTIDITAPDAVERFTHLIELCNGVDVVLMASGVGFQNPGLEPGKETAILETNVVGWARIVAAAYKYFRDTRNNAAGRIAAITSVAGTHGLGLAAAYSASKRFQRTYLEALEQLATTQRANVKFTDIRPGFVRTPLLDPNKNYPMILNADYAATQVELAILRGKRVSTIDWRWRLLNAAWSCIPSSWWVNVSIDVLDKDDSQLREFETPSTLIP